MAKEYTMFDDVVVRVDSGKIYLKASTPYRDPVELTEPQARDVAAVLREVAEQSGSVEKRAKWSFAVNSVMQQIGEVRVGIDDESIRLHSLDRSSDMPLLLAPDQAIELAVLLEKLAEELEK